MGAFEKDVMWILILKGRMEINQVAGDYLPAERRHTHSDSGARKHVLGVTGKTGASETPHGFSRHREPDRREVRSETCASSCKTGGRIAFREGHPGARRLAAGGGVQGSSENLIVLKDVLKLLRPLAGADLRVV